MTDKLIFAVPSKGRLMDATLAVLSECGLILRKTGHERGYSGEIEGLPRVEVNYVSASEIAHFLKTGQVHMGVTGEDLVRESMINADECVSFLKPLGFGFADVVVAVPECWIDVRHMSDLEDMAITFRRKHGRRLRVATKYMNTTRRFFASHGVMSYRIVESLGATEGAPAASTAELIVDITTSGATLAANGLKVLEDGVILQSEANLMASKAAHWTPGAREAENEIMARLGA